MGEIDLSQYLDLFLQEAEEQIEVLEDGLLKLEAEPTTERVQTVFRAAHTLKGSSRAMGFTRFADLTHEMENLLDLVRSGQMTVDRALADGLLAGVDVLGQMREEIQAGRGDSIDCAPLVRELQALGHREPSAAHAPGQVAEPVRFEGEAHRFQVRLVEDCVIKFARAFMAISVVEEHGELLSSQPGQQELEEEKFEREFTLYVKTDDPAGLLEGLRAITEVEHVAHERTEPEPSAKPEPEARAEAVELRAEAGGKNASQTVRVDVARLDSLMNLVGELVIDRTRIAQIGHSLSERYGDDNLEALSETVSHIARITSDLQDEIMKARMLPIDTVLNRFPRVVRDLAAKLGKEVRLEIVGGDTELDRSVIEVIGDPLLHIVRNSLDHGVEMPDERRAAGKSSEGTIRVSAWHQESHIVIEIADDGHGIDVSKVRAKAVSKGWVSREAAERMSDREALQLIFMSGLSTAEQVSEISGRGVGMDIVKTNLQKLGGLIDLDTELGVGTKTTLRLPLTLAIIQGLLVESAGCVYVIPLTSVVETMMLEPASLQRINRREAVVIRGVTTPVLRLRTLFDVAGSGRQEPPDALYMVVVGLAEQRIGLVVDRLIGEQEVVIKSLSRYFGEVPGVSGATILGDGNVALIMDVNGVVSN